MKVIITPTIVAKEYHPDEPFDEVEINNKRLAIGSEVVITDEDYSTLFNSTFTPSHGLPCKYFDITVTCTKNEQQIKEEELANLLLGEVKLYTAIYATITKQDIINASHRGAATTAIYERLSNGKN